MVYLNKSSKYLCHEVSLFLTVFFAKRKKVPLLHWLFFLSLSLSSPFPLAKREEGLRSLNAGSPLLLLQRRNERGGDFCKLYYPRRPFLPLPLR